jgi:hypothetical protein
MLGGQGGCASRYEECNRKPDIDIRANVTADSNDEKRSLKPVITGTTLPAGRAGGCDQGPPLRPVGREDAGLDGSLEAARYACTNASAKRGDPPRVPMNTEYLKGQVVEHDNSVIEPQGRNAVMLAALRDNMADALGGSSDGRPTKRAKNQTTPQKLRHSVESYYDDVMQLDVLRDTLRSPLRAWLTYIGSEVSVDEALDVIVGQHVKDS